ncbi:glycosyltransferase family A protein [Bordetella holmesii]|nr:glycosyltransferase family A protein [Bordetella holmesii]UEB21719.1 glycosyltransferase family 2 protein [Bordetella holmesii]
MLQAWQVLHRHADDPLRLNRIGLFETSQRTKGGGLDCELARARAMLEWTGADARLHPADFSGRVSDFERQQYALTLGRQNPEQANTWLKRSESALSLAMALAASDADAAQWHAAALPTPRRTNLKKANNLHAVVAAQHCLAGQFGQARKHLTHLLTNAGGELATTNRPLTMDEFYARKTSIVPSEIQDHVLVSVIICARDAESYIDNTLLSVERQTYQNIEIVAVDDGSTDNTFQHILAAASINARINPLRIDNCGTYAARNIALTRSRGSFITFLDADDVMLPRRIERQLGMVHAYRAMACTSRLLRLTALGQLVSPRIYPLIRHNPASMMMRREVLDRLGPYEEVRFGADDEYEHRIRLHCGTGSVVRDADVHTIALHRDDSLTQSPTTGLNSPTGRQGRIRYREDWIRRHMEEGLSGRQLSQS